MGRRGGCVGREKNVNTNCSKKYMIMFPRKKKQGKNAEQKLTSLTEGQAR